MQGMQLRVDDQFRFVDETGTVVSDVAELLRGHGAVVETESTQTLELQLGRGGPMCGLDQRDGRALLRIMCLGVSVKDAFAATRANS